MYGNAQRECCTCLPFTHLHLHLYTDRVTQLIRIIKCKGFRNLLSYMLHITKLKTIQGGHPSQVRNMRV